MKRELNYDYMGGEGGEQIEKLHNNVTYIFQCGEEKVKIEGTVGVKQGDNLGPILFIYLIQAVATTLDKKWNFFVKKAISYFSI